MLAHEPVPFARGLDELAGLAEALARSIKRKLKLPTVRLSGPASRKIRKIAICTGSGGSFLSRIGPTGAQAYITGEITYHYGVEAHQRGISVLELGHFETEQIVAGPLAERLGGEPMLKEAGVPTRVAMVAMRSKGASPPGPMASRPVGRASLTPAVISGRLI